MPYPPSASALVSFSPSKSAHSSTEQLFVPCLLPLAIHEAISSTISIRLHLSPGWGRLRRPARVRNKQEEQKRERKTSRRKIRWKSEKKTGEGAMGAALLRTLRQRKTYKMLQLLVTWRQWLVLFNWQQCWLLHWGFETGNVTYGGCNGRRKLCPMRHPHGYFKNPSRPGLSSGCGLPDRTLSVLSLRI